MLILPAAQGLGVVLDELRKSAVPNEVEAIAIVAGRISMYPKWAVLKLSLLLPLFTTPCMANDSEAALGVGGLVFQQSKHVEMLSEELFVSSEQIVVDYRFRNVGRVDSTSLIAFPLPEIRLDPDELDVSFYGDDDDFIKFSTLVDGVAVEMNVERKAMLQGRDEAATLERYAVPLNPVAAVPFLQEADQSLVKALQELSLVDVDGSPAWALKITYYWEQTFPPGKEVRIEHRYRPIVGGSVGTSVDLNYDDRSFYDRFCVDHAFLRAASAATRGAPISERFAETYIEYILTTGANWRGPIRNFRLVVDKGSEENLVSFCGEGVRKIGRTSFEMTASNFTPQRNLAVLILMPRERIDDAPGGTQESELDELSCDALWHKRNSLFKVAGYCFKTKRAIAEFGNAGCRYDHTNLVPLSDTDRQLVKRIQAAEETKRCQR